MEEERVVSAATEVYTIQGDIITLHGVRHWDGYMNSQFELYGFESTDIDFDVQGFITNKHRFINRKEAFTIAHKAGQILFTEGWNKVEEVDGQLSGVLYSENLY